MQNTYWTGAMFQPTQLKIATTHGDTTFYRIVHFMS